MRIQSDEFNLILNNIPTINLRNEFLRNFDILTQKKFREKFLSSLIEPIQTHYIHWYGMPNGLITLMLQRAIIGIEAYVCAAVYHECGVRGTLHDNMKHIMNPYSLRGRGTAENYYNILPSKVSRDYMLKEHNLKMWDKTKKLYSVVRNPIFHGYEIEKSSINGVLLVYHHIAKLYEWIDIWHNPENIMPGFGEVMRIQKEISDRCLTTG